MASIGPASSNERAVSFRAASVGAANSRWRECAAFFLLLSDNRHPGFDALGYPDLAIVDEIRANVPSRGFVHRHWFGGDRSIRVQFHVYLAQDALRSLRACGIPCPPLGKARW